MTGPDLLKPALYASSPDGIPKLRGGRCANGHVFFPLQAYGCERCGAHGEALTPVLLEGRGRLVALSMVHVHAGKSRQAPFVIGVVALDEGPIVRTLLDGVADADVQPGTAMVATLREVTAGEDGKRALDLRFTKAA